MLTAALLVISSCKVMGSGTGSKCSFVVCKKNCDVECHHLVVQKLSDMTGHHRGSPGHEENLLHTSYFTSEMFYPLVRHSSHPAIKP